MNLEQTTEQILAAAEAQDLALLETACKQRDAAMAELSSVPPTLGLRNAVAASLAAGEGARRAIRAIRQRLRKESRYLTSIETGLRPEAVQRIDCKG